MYFCDNFLGELKTKRKDWNLEGLNYSKNEGKKKTILGVEFTYKLQTYDIGSHAPSPREDNYVCLWNHYF